MAFQMNDTSQIKARLGLEPNGRVQKFFTNSCAKHMDKYVPMDEGTLAETVIIDGQPTRNVATDTITYTQPYARYVYYGISKSGKPLRYSLDKHKDAVSYWDKHMVSAEMHDIIDEVQEYVNRGGK